MVTPGHRYELHRSNTHDTDEQGRRSIAGECGPNGGKR
jgi:hypothetical protein